MIPLKEISMPNNLKVKGAKNKGSHECTVKMCEYTSQLLIFAMQSHPLQINSAGTIICLEQGTESPYDMLGEGCSNAGIMLSLCVPDFQV